MKCFINHEKVLVILSADYLLQRGVTRLTAFKAINKQVNIHGQYTDAPTIPVFCQGI